MLLLTGDGGYGGAAASCHLLGPPASVQGHCLPGDWWQCSCKRSLGCHKCTHLFNFVWGAYGQMQHHELTDVVCDIVVAMQMS